LVTLCFLSFSVLAEPDYRSKYFSEYKASTTTTTKECEIFEDWQVITPPTNTGHIIYDRLWYKVDGGRQTVFITWTTGDDVEIDCDNNVITLQTNSDLDVIVSTQKYK